MLDIVMRGGWMMIPIIACSVVGMTIAIERLVFFRSWRHLADANRMLKLLQQGKTADALALAEQRPSPLARVLAAGILHRADSPHKAMEAAGIEEIAAMKRGLPVLDTVITLGPLLGLLGTIIGMIQSFRIMAESGLGTPHAVTGGVAEALICTAAGIAVAVTTLVPYNYFLSRIEQATACIERYATQAEVILSQLNLGDPRA